MAKISPQVKAQALSVVATMSSSIAERGHLPNNKAGLVLALTALRLSRQMDQVCELVEQNEDILTVPIDKALERLEELLVQPAPVEEVEEEETKPPGK